MSVRIYPADWTGEPAPADPPLNLTLSTTPVGNLTVSVRHDDGATVFGCTSSFMTQLDMSPARWREFLERVRAKLDGMEQQNTTKGGK